MKSILRSIILFSFLCLALVFVENVAGQSPGTAFVYQGQLATDGALTTATCNFRFTLFDAATAGNAVGSPLTRNGTAVSNGLFATSLDFGAGAFTGAPRWLAIEVQCPDDAALVPLFPRQQLSPTPYAIYASSVPWNGITDKPGWATNGFAAGTGLNLTGSTFSVDTNAIQQRVTGSCDLGLAMNAINANGTVECAAPTENDPSAWHLEGNTAAAGQFLGTTNAAPLELRVNNRTALRFFGGSNDGTGKLNLVAGESDNVMDVTSQGSVIGGGKENSNSADFAVIAGGATNIVDGIYGVVAGGVHNQATGPASAVGGGVNNSAAGDQSAVSGGSGNRADGGFAAVGGGSGNAADGNFSFVPGGSNGVARLYGQMAHASGSFASAGDAQAAEYVLRAEVSANSTHELFLDGTNGFRRLEIPDGALWAAEVQVVARAQDGDSATALFHCMIRNEAGAVQGNCAIEYGFALPPQGIVFGVAPYDPADALVISVTVPDLGIAKTFRAVATVRTTEVTFP